MGLKPGHSCNLSETGSGNLQGNAFPLDPFGRAVLVWADNYKAVNPQSVQVFLP